MACRLLPLPLLAWVVLAWLAATPCCWASALAPPWPCLGLLSRPWLCPLVRRVVVHRETGAVQTQKCTNLAICITGRVHIFRIIDCARVGSLRLILRCCCPCVRSPRCPHWCCLQLADGGGLPLLAQPGPHGEACCSRERPHAASCG